MKHFLLLFIIPIATFGTEKTYKINIYNPTPFPKVNSPVVISLKSIDGLDIQVRSAIITQGGEPVTYQLDDLDGDGENDELCFMSNINSNSHQFYKIILSDQITTHHLHPLLYNEMMLDDKKGIHPHITVIESSGSSNLFNDLYHHGVAFESELTGYRIYYDNRQNIDIYGKKYYRLELSETHFYTDSLHQSADYGNDVLWAGSNIGCGSLKLWDGIHFTNWDNVEVRGQRIISCGPIRSIVEMYDKGVVIKDRQYNIHTYYTQYSGHRDVSVDVYLNHPIITPFLCTGVQKIGNSTEALSSNGGIHSEGYISNNLAASWGSDYPEMGKKTQFPPEPIGLAVYVSEDYQAASNIDENNYLFIIGKQGQQHIRYYISFCASKELNGFHDASSWFAYLSTWHPEELTYELNEM